MSVRCASESHPPRLAASIKLRAVWLTACFGTLFAWQICPGIAAADTSAIGGTSRGTRSLTTPDEDTSFQPCMIYPEVGRLVLGVSNSGTLGNPWHDGYSATWRGNEYLNTAALWIGAIAADNQPYVSTGFDEAELVGSSDPINTVYTSYAGISGGNQLGHSDSPDDDADGLIDEDFLNGKDDDGDGVIDEDYGAISDLMTSCEYWDYGEESTSENQDHRPLHLRVRQRTFSWSHPEYDEFVGVEYEVINDGFETLRDVYVGVCVDGDIGPRSLPGSRSTVPKPSRPGTERP